MSQPGKLQTKAQMSKTAICNAEYNIKAKDKKSNLLLCKKVTTEIIFILMSDYNIKNIEVKQSTYGSIYIEFYESTIRISDHEIDTINYSYQIIINNYRIDKINRQELTKIIY